MADDLDALIQGLQYNADLGFGDTLDSAELSAVLSEITRLQVEVERLTQQLADNQTVIDASEDTTLVYTAGAMSRDEEVAKLRAELEAVRPKKFVSPPGTFEIAELSDTVESDGKVYINYDDFMDVLHRHAATERKLASVTRERADAERIGFNAGIEAAKEAITNIGPYGEDNGLCRLVPDRFNEGTSMAFDVVEALHKGDDHEW